MICVSCKGEFKLPIIVERSAINVSESSDSVRRTGRQCAVCEVTNNVARCHLPSMRKGTFQVFAVRTHYVYFSLGGKFVLETETSYANTFMFSLERSASELCSNTTS